MAIDDEDVVLSSRHNQAYFYFILTESFIFIQS